MIRNKGKPTLNILLSNPSQLSNGIIVERESNGVWLPSKSMDNSQERISQLTYLGTMFQIVCIASSLKVQKVILPKFLIWREGDVPISYIFQAEGEERHRQKMHCANGSVEVIVQTI